MARKIVRNAEVPDEPTPKAGLPDFIDSVLRDDVSGVILCDNMVMLRALSEASVDLVYIDPPFNTGKAQTRRFTQTSRSDQGARTGFGGHRYASKLVSKGSYLDTFPDYLEFLEPRLLEIHRILKASGTLYLHLDYREVHYCKVYLDQLFGRSSFLNEIIWAYDYGARPKRKWPSKHDTILVYTKDPTNYYFNTEEVERIPYMAPGLAGPEKAQRGKLPTDTWWHTIVSPTGKEKCAYPTQKPLGILRRIVAASCPEGGRVLDCFAGSGTTGAAANELGRTFLLADSSPQAYDVMRKRFATQESLRFASEP